MEEKKFDAVMTELLKDKAEPAAMPSDRAETMKRRLRTMMKEESHMKKIKARKVIVAVAAMCLLVSVVSVAGGRIAGYTSSTNRSEAIKSYDKIIKAAPGKLGFTPAAVKEFGNGFAFDDGYLMDVDAIDDSANVVGTYPEMTLDYAKGGQSATLTVSKPIGEQAKVAADAVESSDGIDISYKVDHYKFVPENYQLTEEDQKRIDSGDLMVSYGADKVELKDISFMSWNQNGITYLLMSSGDSTVSQADLMQMAKELIAAGK